MWHTHGAGGRISAENISNVCPQRTLAFSPLHSSGEFKSTLQRCSGPFTMDPHCTSYNSIHSSALQLYTPDLEICLSSSFHHSSDTINHTQENQPKPVFPLTLRYGGGAAAGTRRVENSIRHRTESLVSDAAALAWQKQQSSVARICRLL